MDFHLLVITLPHSIRSRLASFCYGIPHVHWVEEENFNLILRNFGPLTDQEAAQIGDRLSTLFFVKFPLTLKGIGHFNSKGDRGSFWVGVEENPKLIALKKEIDQLLRDLPLRPEERNFHPHIILGRYERLSRLKLADYLALHAHYQSEPFEVQCCQLVTVHHTPKHLYYKVVEEMHASPPATGDD